MASEITATEEDMKFLHSADWQIGMKALHVDVASSRIREARIDTAGRVIEVAKREGAEFILLAGDTFESNAIDRVAVQRIGDILAHFNGPVYLLPGNHDPINVGSVWEHPVWLSHSNIHILREAQPVKLPSGILYPCPVTSTSAKSKCDPTGWILPERGSGFRIGVAHGTVEGNPAMEPPLPIPRSAACRAGLDYLALGHWHSTATYEDSDGVVTMAYSGTHEPTTFGERDSGNVLVIEISEPLAKPDVRTIPIGTLRWSTIQKTLIGPGQLRDIRASIEAMPEPASSLIQIRLNGVLFSAEFAEIRRIEEILSARFLHGRLDVTGLGPAPSDDDWVSGLPPGFLRNAAARLSELADSNDDENGRVVAARALRELYALRKEGAA